MEKIKVFELAKQLGLETIGLMDKLREFKIPVKSHMAELDDETVSLIRSRFEQEEVDAAAAKKKTVKRKAPAKSAAAKPTVVKSSAVKKPAEASETVKAAPKKSASKASATATTTTRTVIRRKALTAEIQPTPVPEPITPEPGEAETQAAAPTAEEVAAATPAKATPEPKKPGGAQVITRIDLSQTMGPPKSETPRPAAPKAATPSGGVDERFDRETMEKLIKQEALAKKASAKDAKPEAFIAADFRKRELLFQPKKKKVLMGRPAQKTQITKPSASKRKIKIEGGITVSNLAQDLGIKGAQIIKQLMNMGSMVKLNDVLDFDTAQIIAQEHGYEIENVEKSEDQLLGLDKLEPKKFAPRPPVVTVMGHVDHGKTSLLDAIRSTRVASGEAGGITQHIGAYSVEINQKKITFLDTPGHEAFTAMRARGAKVTDIVILVVAADDGIMPQTREAIVHAKSAGVPIIVAVNKMDLPGANPQKVLQSLTEFELVPEEWGGTTIVAKVSALKKEGIQELLEMILLQAEVLELKAPVDVPAAGTVIEARLERGRGPVATLLVSQGQVKVGDILVAGLSQGRVRGMQNDRREGIKVAGPGDPVEVIGLDSVPGAGDSFNIVESEAIAGDLVEKRKQDLKAKSAQPAMKMTLEELFAKAQESELKELNVLVKADVQGSTEALKDMLTKLSNDQVKVKVLSAATGGITESDVLLASASNAIIIGFNVRPESGVPSVAAREGVQIKTYSIIYEVVDDVKKAMTGLLAPTFVEKSLGRAEVRELFNVPKIGTIAGCSVLDGRITRQSLVRLLRDSRIVYEGKLASLKRFKDDVREVQTGFECGLSIENYNDLKVGDVIEAYVKEQVGATLN